MRFTTDMGIGQNVSDAIIVAIVSGLFTLLGSFAGAMTSHNLTAYLLQQLEAKVEKHNQVVERTALLEEKMKVANHRLDDLEESQKG